MRVHALVTSAAEAAAAVTAGATVVQVRLKLATTEQRAALGGQLVDLPAILVINDDVAAAIRCGAAGVHLGQSDSGTLEALAAGLLLGVSASSTAEAVAAEQVGAAYIGAGPVWATPSKTDAGPPIGLKGLAAICAAVSVPVVAIGGVDAANAAACIRAGAAGVAVVRAAADPAVRRAVDHALAATTGAAG